MKTAIVVLTYRRLDVLKAMMAGIEEHCPQYRCAIFEDCGQRDSTSELLSRGRTPNPVKELMATEWVDDTGNPSVVYPNAQVFLGDRNLGVTGNSNRAIRWFMTQTECDHLLLCNDDLFVKGDFARVYAKAHERLGVGMFCFCDFDKASPAISGNPESYQWMTHNWRGYKVKLLPRMTGIMMSFTREVVEKIGYYDAEFGKFGEEHCDYTIRAGFGGFIHVDGQPVSCIDIEHDTLAHQDVTSSVTGSIRRSEDQYAHRIMQRAAHEYRFRHYYRPFRLVYPSWGGAYGGAGVPVRQLEQIGYKIVSDLV